MYLTYCLYLIISTSQWLLLITVSITGMNCNGKYPAKHYTDSFGFEEEKSNIMNSEIKKPHFPPGFVCGW